MDKDVYRSEVLDLLSRVATATENLVFEIQKLREEVKPQPRAPRKKKGVPTVSTGEVIQNLPAAMTVAPPDSAPQSLFPEDYNNHLF